MSALAAFREAHGLCPTSWGLAPWGRIRTKYLRTWVKPLNVLVWSAWLRWSSHAGRAVVGQYKQEDTQTYMEASSLSQALSVQVSSLNWLVSTTIFLSVVTLGSGLHAFHLSSAQIKKILCILGALRWGNSVKHIRWWGGTFYDEECLYSHTHKHTKKPFSKPVLAPGMLHLIQMGPLCPTRKPACF